MDERRAESPDQGLDLEESIARLLRLAGPRPAVPQERDSRVRVAVHGQWRGLTRRRRRLFWGSWLAVGLTAAALAFVLAGEDLWRVLGILPSPGASIAAIVHVEGMPRTGDGAPAGGGAGLFPESILQCGAGDRAALRMAGGAMVRVDRRSTVRVASASILVLEHGAVYLDSEPEGLPASPVAIHTPRGIVRHLGTRLEVRLSDAGMRVTVRAGIARLETEGRSYEVEAGTRLSMDDNGVSRGEAPAHGTEWDWILDVAPPFDIEGRSLGEFLAWVAQETGRRIEFADPSIASGAPGIALHGSIAGLRPDEAPEAVLPTCGLRHRVEGDALIIEQGGSPVPHVPPTFDRKRGDVR